MELTDAGHAMLEPARAAIRATEQAERAAREAARVTGHPQRFGHLCPVPFDPPLWLPGYVSWQAERSAVVDAFVGEPSALSDGTTAVRSGRDGIVAPPPVDAG